MENTTAPLEFWCKIWEEGVIRFHQKDYNSQMVAFFKDRDLTDQSVLIPLAGKTKDILFFLEKGAKVTAVEFCQQAVVDFFTENKIPYTKNENIYQGKNITFFASDFFNFSSTAPFDVLYDRASQVVFNRADRPRYYQQIAKLIHPKTLLLLGSIDHDGPEDFGPPFKISAQEISLAYQSMGINLTLFAGSQETSSEKMQSMGIANIYSFFLTNK